MTSGSSRDINTASKAGATSACKEKVVATTSSCRDNNCTERMSRQDQAVATTIVQKRGRDKIKLSRHQLHFKLVATTQRPATRTATRPATRTATRTEVATRNVVVTTSAYWASLLKSNKKCLEIRAQLQNPINM